MARNKYPEETVRHILDVAEELFMSKGYEHTTMADIVGGLGGLTKGAVYHHFKSKEEIFEAVFERANEPREDPRPRRGLGGGALGRDVGRHATLI